MKLVVFENGPFMVNTYLAVNEDGNRGFILDPGSEMEQLIEFILKEKISLEAIVCTHGHIDHVAGVSQIKNKFNIPFYLNDLEDEIIKSIPVQARMFGVPDPGVPDPDKNLPLSGDIEFAGLNFTLLHTPGHSMGSISLYSEGVVFSGDALFNMSIGRTDLPGGNYDQLITAIKEKLFVLPDETQVLCGHGPATAIGYEKKMNPFF